MNTSISMSKHFLAILLILAFCGSVQAAEQHSITVLPFNNDSGDPDQNYLGAVSTHNVINILSKNSGLLVVTGKAASGESVKQIGEALDVRYVLEGSVQQTGDQIQLTAKLGDAPKEQVVWSDSYDRATGEIFDVHDDMTRHVVATMGIKPSPEEEQRAWRRQTNNLEAYRDVLRGRDHLLHFTKGEVAEARRLFEQVVEMDPEFAYGWDQLGIAIALQTRVGTVEDSDSVFTQATDMAKKALSIDEHDANAYALLGNITRWQGKHDESVTYLEKAVALDPNNAVNIGILAASLGYIPGRYEDSLASIDKAIRLNPNGPAWYASIRGGSLFYLDRYDEALEAFKQYVERNPEHAGGYADLAMSYAQLGQLDEARAAVAKLLELRADFTVKDHWQARETRNPAMQKRMLDALIKAGVPE